MTRNDFSLKWMVYGIALFLVLILNYYVLTLLPLKAVPLLLPMMVVAVGILEGARAGAGFGIAAGLVLAAATHGSVLWVGLLSLCGWVCGLLAQYVLRQDFVGFLPAALVLELLRCGYQVISGWTGGTAELTVLLQVALTEYLWTILFAIPVYGMCHFCCRHYGRIYHE